MYQRKPSGSSLGFPEYLYVFLREVLFVFAENSDSEQSQCLLFCLAIGARILEWELTLDEHSQRTVFCMICESLPTFQ